MPDLDPADESEVEDGRVEKFIGIARTLVSDWPRFYPMLNPEAARFGIRAFKSELRSRAFAEFCVDYSDKPICGGNLALDYLIGSTVVEIAMNLRDQNSEFERDILKVLMAQSELLTVTHLLFLAKPGARARCDIPARKAVVAWAEREYGVRVEVRELGASAEAVLDIGDE